MVAGWLSGWGAREKYLYKNEIRLQIMMSMFSLTLLGFYSPFQDCARACTSHAGVYSTLFSGSGLVSWVSTEAQSKASNEEKWFLWEMIPESTGRGVEK